MSLLQVAFIVLLVAKAFGFGHFPWWWVLIPIAVHVALDGWEELTDAEEKEPRP